MKFPFKLLKDKRFDVVGFGTNAVDFLIQVPAYPEFNSKVELVDYTQAPGGEVASTMAGLQRLGLSASYAGRFGDDPAGDIGYASLEEEGVDLTYAERIAGARTQIAFIIIDTRNGERTVIWKRDERLQYQAADAPLAGVSEARIVHMTPHDTSACIEMARAARSEGVIVSIDIDRTFNGIEDLLPLVDILIASSDLPAALTGLPDPGRSLERLREIYGCGIVGVTLGEEGSLVLGPEGLVETPAYPVPGGCVDTTGAGDSFRVGILYGVLTGRSVEESCRFANAVAALKCRAVGARTALPGEAELIEFVEGFG
ncbi:MAG: carbohydrate kinase family protein [Pyrinomonadaceae bacterium]